METATSQLELLEKKLALIQRMHDMTESVELSNTHAEENYITLMSRREAIMTQLRDLDLGLSECVAEKGADALLAQIREVSEQILELDRQMALRIPDLMKGIKNNLKQIKDGRNINRAYNKDIFSIIGEGSYRIKK